MATSAQLGTLPQFDPHRVMQGSVGGAANVNPAFDPRIFSTNPYFAGLQQGFLIRDDYSAKLNFLYNPSDFAESWQATNTLNPHPDPNDTAALLGAVPANCTFSLLFDRTYEVNTTLGTNNSHASGVGVDVEAAKRLVGIDVNNGSPMTIKYVKLYLGNINSVVWHGFTTDFGVTYTHWSVNMVPMRAAITMSMTLVLANMTQPAAPAADPGPPAPGAAAPRPGVAPRTRADLPGTPAQRAAR